MMKRNEIIEYIEGLQKIYGDRIIVKKSPYDEKMLSQIPKPLQEFYAVYESLETPFGSVYSLEVNFRDSENKPFREQGWFSFGFDGYFSFWLCSYQADQDGNYFASWDHEIDDEIEAIEADFTAFLEYMREEYEENKEE